MIAAEYQAQIGQAKRERDTLITERDRVKAHIERGPLVFFGSSDGGPYWADQVAMLRRMAREGRAPGWIHDSVLLSDRPADVVRFYRSVLDLA